MDWGLKDGGLLSLRVLGGVMLRIVILESDREKAYALFQTAQVAVRKCNVKCELSHTKDYDKLSGNLAENKKYYDILIFNAQDENALRIAQSLRKVNMAAAILFTNGGSARLNDLLQYRPSAIINPQDQEEVIATLEFCIREQVRNTGYFTVRNKDALLRVNFDEISHIESRQRIAVMYAGSKVYEFYAKLGDIYQMLPQDLFVRCHQSYIVNMNLVRTLDKGSRSFHMQSGAIVEISKANYAQTLAQYEAYLEQ